MQTAPKPAEFRVKLQRAHAIAASPIWPLIAETIAEKLSVSRNVLENTNTDERRAQIERGKIAAYKEILALAELPVLHQL